MRPATNQIPKPLLQPPSKIITPVATRHHQALNEQTVKTEQPTSSTPTLFPNKKMSDEKALLPMKRTNESLKQIKATLTPFLTLLDKYHNQTSETSKSKFDRQEIAEAEAAVSLAMGTLRYMAHRLKGHSKGKKKNDPLRMELDKMRRTLVQCKGLRKENKNQQGGEKDKQNDKKGSASKRRRIEEDTKSAKPREKKSKK